MLDINPWDMKIPRVSRGFVCCFKELKCCLFFLRSYSSGGEDGYVRVHVFDPSYFEVEFEY